MVVVSAYLALMQMLHLIIIFSNAWYYQASQLSIQIIINSFIINVNIHRFF